MPRTRPRFPQRSLFREREGRGGTIMSTRVRVRVEMEVRFTHPTPPGGVCYGKKPDPAP